MPGIKPLLGGWNESSGKNKLADFANEYWRYDNITKKAEKQFIASYIKLTKKNGYHQNQDKATKIYCLAKSGIPTISSCNPTTKMLVQEEVKVLRRIVNKDGFVSEANKNQIMLISNSNKRRIGVLNCKKPIRGNLGTRSF